LIRRINCPRPGFHVTRQSFEKHVKPMTQHPFTKALLEIAHKAGDLIMSYYGPDIAVAHKADQSPVTQADQAAEDVILEALETLAPDIPVISEEAAGAGRLPAVGRRFLLVDPLDGTKEFIRQNGEFTVNIGLIEQHRPVAGVVFAPALNRVFWTGRSDNAHAGRLDHASAFHIEDERIITVRDKPQNGLTVIASRSHANRASEDLLRDYKVAETIAAGSSLKFCLIAAGEADLYPRAGRTMEWDTAAGHAVLHAAGGSVVKLDETPLVYGKADAQFANPPFLARSWQ
jgi:3'(2'), 5'-bisphosphate nucleotidase